MAFSAGFSPHPKISYVGAAPTGVASEAEYVEIGLAAGRPGAAAGGAGRQPAGRLDVLECVEARAGHRRLPDRVDASRWRVALPGVAPAELPRGRGVPGHRA